MEYSLEIINDFFLKLKELGYSFVLKNDFFNEVREEYLSKADCELEILHPEFPETTDLFDSSVYFIDVFHQEKGKEEKKDKKGKKGKKGSKCKRTTEPREDFSIHQYIYLNSSTPDTNFFRFRESLMKKLDIYYQEFVFLKIGSISKETYSTTYPEENYIRWNGSEFGTFPGEKGFLERKGDRDVISFTILARNFAKEGASKGEFSKGSFTLSISNETRKVFSISDDGNAVEETSSARIYSVSNIKKVMHYSTRDRGEEFGLLLKPFHEEEIMEYLYVLEKYVEDPNKYKEDLEKLVKRFETKNVSYFNRNVEKTSKEAKSSFIRKALNTMKAPE